MFCKKKLMLTLIALSGVTPAALANTTTSTEKSEKSEKSKAIVAAKSSKKASCANDKSKCYLHSRFQIGPYINKDRLFDGSELIINTPTVREDARLLLQQYKLLHDCATLGIPLPQLPRMTISGKLEGLYTYNNPYTGKNNSDISIDAAELDLFIQATSWLSGYMALDYDPTRSISAGSVFMNRAFVILGNLNVTPFYASAGKMYVPFGRYSSNMVTSPATLVLGRTRANAVVLGYQQTGANALHAEVYIFQGQTHYLNDGEKNHLEYGSDIGYAYKLGNISGEFGGGIISNLADSQSFHNSIYNNGYTFISQRIPALDVYGSMAYKQFNFIAEYIQALRAFDQNTVAFDNHGAQPSAFNTELSYNFKSFNRPSSVAVGYSHASQAVVIGIPENSYRAVYNINIWRNTNLAIELRHDVNYSLQDAAGTNVDTSQLGKSANTISVEFDYFF